ncbi:MAG: hypothetical protein MJA32_06260 [Proteobacteria bacterium]|nr:hypothetical protein [Pseudomonadota bacterium]
MTTYLALLFAGNVIALILITRKVEHLVSDIKKKGIKLLWDDQQRLLFWESFEEIIEGAASEAFTFGRPAKVSGTYSSHYGQLKITVEPVAAAEGVEIEDNKFVDKK